MCLIKLVNKQNALDATFVPKELMQDESTGIWLCKTALEAFYVLNFRRLSDRLMPLILVSGYRPYTYQKNLYDKKIAAYLALGFSEENARKTAGSIVAMPGQSEHQLGLAIDVTSSSMKDLEDPLISNFEETEEGKWLRQHAHEYGFILRYPKDKTMITGITYEPWHYRYVGLAHAAEMKKTDQCLEEYLNTLS